MRRRKSNWCCAPCHPLGGLWILVALCTACQAQFGIVGGTAHYDLSANIQVEEAGRTVRTYLDRVDSYLADGKWSEAVDSIRQVMEDSGDKLLPVSSNRYVPTRTICHLKLADFPPEALAVYRDLVDPIAGQWFRKWQNDRDLAALERIVSEAFNSSWGDDALAALGEASFEAGHYAQARAYWQRILPFEPSDGASRTWLSFPDTDLNLAAIRARIIMLSIFENRADEAEGLLAEFEGLHPDARGRLGGQEVLLVNALKSLIQESRGWPDLPQRPDWPTFAGSPRRERQAIEPAAVGEIAWQEAVSLPERKKRVSVLAEPKKPRVAERDRMPLSNHPVLTGNLLLLGAEAEILAWDASSGKPAWGQDSRSVFRDPLYGTVKGGVLDSDALGTSRHTLTVADGRLYARMGSGVTVLSQQRGRTRSVNYLICLDLRSQGRLVWKAIPEDGWAYEGTPLAEGDDVYVAMRRSDIRPQAYVACLDARTGAQRWRQFVCGAETPSRGVLAERTNGLLTLDGDTLYFNTNLGAVAALATRDGRIRWLTTYPRALKGDLLAPADHWARDLTPCLIDRGTLYVAPADTPYVFAVAADNGQMLWQSSPELADVVHLLGVCGDNLIASGRRLLWIRTSGDKAGQVRVRWPEGHEQIGYGRGLLTRDHVWWPAKSNIFVFDKRSAKLVRRIDLVPRGATGGHLLVADRRLVIASADRLTAFASASLPEQPEEPLVQYAAPPP